MEDQKRTFKFYMTDPYMGEEFQGEWTIKEHDQEFEEELDYLLDQFKRFLLMCGWPEGVLSRLQYLEDDEWKYVLTQYNEWDSQKEEVYKSRKAFRE